MLVDSNTSLRILQPGHPQHKTALDAVRMLTRGRQKLCVVPQNLVEVRAVATRPIDAQNGIGMSIEQATRALSQLKDLFTVLADREETYAIWESLVIKHRVSGKATHDARIVAAMKVHGERSILTFNGSDFSRYPGIEAIDPATASQP